MATNGTKLLTPEIALNGQLLYLVRRNSEEKVICKTEEEAVYAIDSLVTVEIRDSRVSSQLFRQDTEGGRVVKIWQAVAGYLRTTNKLIATYDFVTVDIGNVTQRKAKTTSVVETLE